MTLIIRLSQNARFEISYFLFSPIGDALAGTGLVHVFLSHPYLKPYIITTVESLFPAHHSLFIVCVAEHNYVCVVFPPIDL